MNHKIKSWLKFFFSIFRMSKIHCKKKYLRKNLLISDSFSKIVHNYGFNNVYAGKVWYGYLWTHAAHTG